MKFLSSTNNQAVKNHDAATALRCYKHINYMPLRCLCLVISVFLCSYNNLYAQTTVSGKVTDESNKAIEGASVRVKGANAGTTTSAAGTFSISVASPGAELVFSYIGYTDQEIKVENDKAINVTLKQSASSINDVIVVGYGTQKKATLTGAVEQVTSKVFESRAVTNIGLALQGETPGLVVTRSSPRPGNEGLALQIRGATSINGGSPLIVIDGVIDATGTWQQLNPDDIESVSILKDGSASIYGARSANGVVLITTKKGKGKLRVDYSNSIRFTTPGITGYSPSLAEYAQLWIEANKEESVPNWWVWAGQGQMDSLAKGYEGFTYTNAWGNIYVANSNRLNELFANRNSYQHNLSLSGSTDRSSYRLSFGFADNQGNLATAYDGQKQYNVRFNNEYRLTDWFKLTSGISVQDAITSSPAVGLDYTLYANDMPFWPAKNPYGQWNTSFGSVGNRNNPAATADGGRDNQTNVVGRIDLTGTFDIYKGFGAELTTSYQLGQYRDEKYVTPVELYDWFGNAQTVVMQTLQATSNPGYSLYSNSTFYKYYAGFLTYNKTFGDHNISAKAGITAEKYQWKNMAAARVTFDDVGVYDINVADPTVQTNSGGKSQEGLYSYIARVNYNYKEKYLVELQGRDDGSSRFAPGFKFKPYGSVQLGWVFTKENFFNENSWLNFGKLRLTYGTMANYAGIGNFDYLSAIYLGTTALGLPASLQSSSGLANNGLISKERTWEQVSQRDIGADLYFINRHLSTTFDYYQKDNDGMLINVNYPSVLGGSAPKTNNGHLRTKGWEVSVAWNDQIKDFSYGIRIGLSNSTNKLLAMEGATTYGAGQNGTVVGKPLGAWYLYQTDGYFKDQAEVDAYYTKYGGNGGLLSSLPAAEALRPGDVKIIDYNGDGVVSNAFDATSSTPADYKYMGDGAPHYVFGINLNAAFKGVDLSAFFQGVASQLIVRQGFMAYPFATIYTNQNVAYIGKTWTEDNPNAEYPRLTVYQNRANWNYQNKDFMLQNSRYIRLKSLILGYTLPATLTRKVGIQRLRVYFSGNDLWEWTSIKDGYDPEQGETTQNSGYPFYRTWSFGLNVGF